MPFDRAGIRAEEMLRLVKLNVVSFGTVLLNAGAVLEPELPAPDLPGLNPDGNALERSVESFRPHLRKLLRERYDIELLALYTYPAQVTFCTRPLTKLADLAGRRIGTSGAAQSDWVAALDGIPAQTAYTDIVSHVRSGHIDCAIAGTMSGNKIGLHEVTSYLHGMPVTWGVAAFVANGDAWNALSSDLQALLRRELPKLEQAIATESARETGEGVACNIGAAACISGRKGRMTEVRPSRADGARRRRILAAKVIPTWQQRCGLRCVQLWAQTVGPASGIDPADSAPPQPTRTAQASR